MINKESTLKDNGRIRIEPKILSRGFMEENLDQFYYLEREWVDLGEKKWNEENFMHELPQKWELSSYISLDEKIIGYSIVSRKSQKEAYLHKILVDRDYRGLGIGSALFQDIMENCRQKNIERLIFKAKVDNIAADKMYKKYGCIIVDREVSSDGIERNLYELNIYKQQV